LHASAAAATRHPYAFPLLPSRSRGLGVGRGLGRKRSSTVTAALSRRQIDRMNYRKRPGAPANVRNGSIADISGGRPKKSTSENSEHRPHYGEAERVAATRTRMDRGGVAPTRDKQGSMSWRPRNDVTRMAKPRFNKCGAGEHRPARCPAGAIEPAFLSSATP
jgi:hypothetical protein